MIRIRSSVVALGFLAISTWDESSSVRAADPCVLHANLDDQPATAAKDKKEKEPAKKHRGKFTIGKDTTYVTGPLDKDGYVDYAAALNERLGKGVTPTNNANVLLWKALGPRPEGKPMPAEFFQLLGIDAPPEKGDYIIDLSRYLKEQLKIDSAEEGDETQEQLRRATQRPWTPKDYPNLAAWLKANEKPLAVAIEATKRSQYYLPLVSPKTDKGPSGLVGVLLPSVQKCREIANALAARAMLRAGQDADDDAWQDLLACHRLGRLIGRGGTLIEGLVGYAIDGMASRADLAFLERTKPNAKRVESCFRDLQKLPPLSGIAEKADLAERFMFLDSVMLIDRYGVDYLEGLAGGKPKGANILADSILRNIDWDPALRNANHWYNRIALALAEIDYGPRDKRLTQIDKELRKLKAETTEPGHLAKLLIGGDSARGKALSDILVALLMPAIRKVQNSADRAQQTQENLVLAFALARYQREHGRYPKDLAALAPKYLKRIPPDLFSGKALIYRPNEDGYLLYSVGVNGKDEDGRGHDDEPPGDDLSVCMPLPELRRK